MDHYNTFSIVIPAYNEEKLISETLAHLQALDYPKDKYFVIVVVNGSTDKTFEKASAFSSETFHIFDIKEKGVSVARNYGIKQCPQETDWYIMLDADSYIKGPFLKELNSYVLSHPKVTYGTAFVRPSDHSLAGKIWFTYINYGVWLLKMFCGIHIVKKDSITKASYAEHLVSAEDIAYAKNLSKHGSFFSLRTRNYFTSTRRLKKEGYVKMFFVNMLVGFFPGKTWREIR